MLCFGATGYPLFTKAVPVPDLGWCWFIIASTCEPSGNQFASPWLVVLKDPFHYDVPIIDISSFFFKSSKKLVLLWNCFFLAQSQFFVSQNRKSSSKLSTWPKPALELLWWKKGISENNFYILKIFFIDFGHGWVSLEVTWTTYSVSLGPIYA